MATRKKKPARRSKRSKPKFQINLNDPRIPKVLGLFMLMIGAFLTLSFVSYLYSWQIDQSFARGSVSEIFANNKIIAANWLGKLGAKTSHWFFFQFIGVTSFIIAALFVAFGAKLLTDKVELDFNKLLGYSFFNIILLSVFFGFVFEHTGFPWGGSFGNFISNYLISFMGVIGTGLFLLFSLLAMLIWSMNPNLDKVVPTITYFFQNAGLLIPKFSLSTANGGSSSSAAAIAEEKPKRKPKKKKEKVKDDLELEIEGEKILVPGGSFEADIDNSFEGERADPEVNVVETKEINPGIAPPKPMVEVTTVVEAEEAHIISDLTPTAPPTFEEAVIEPSIADDLEPAAESDIPIELVDPAAGELEEEEGFKTTEEKVTIERADYDPHADLSKFKMPKSDLLEYYGQDKGTIDRSEIERNKDRIVETLSNYNIGITKISAKVGPTITLYEIVPAKGIRISKIKNLGDDIALSLAALGIRIIAPIPGKGTIGIEVPNKKKEIVSLRSLLESPRFKESTYDLPIAIGTSISRGIHIADLAKMPHLLMAGATGQGKSVGLNDIIISLLYAKHPSELKLVLIDPKKVELSIYERLEKHYLATLPGADEAILTETTKVVHTLNSLCIEMDDRYNLLKMASVRNIKQYNNKFIKRRLNPEKGHRFLPYIVLVIDEFADLIMTAGKEIETPLTRLAQLSRAIGIHLIIATQRPTTNIITGTIKANFPGRIAFKVSSIIDSKTILDYKGADQLIGMGDMLLFQNSDIIRMQCAFVDTPEVERVIENISEQKGYASAWELPEYVDERENKGALGEGDRDEYFDDAAMLVVRQQKGSTSMIQRKLSLGYNRAGRIMDQLEDSGIVGPARGSKPREVLFPDEYELLKFLSPDQ